MDMDRRELADFLRRSRERLRPREVGLTEGPRRRTPGLRREEVSQLAGMSADYYMRLEQARSPQPSTQLLRSLARALRLTEDERDHLYVLAGHRPPAGPFAGEHVRPGLLYLLDRLDDTPATIIGDLGDVLAQNSMSEFLFGCVCTVEPVDRNIVWRWFTDPFVREAYPEAEHERYSRLHVADLRAAVARRGNDAVASALVGRLHEASDEFTRLWERHEVAVRRSSRMKVLHPEIGAMEFDAEILLTPAEDQRLVVFTPPPGSPTVEALELLGVIGAETVHRSHV
ncbi:helix-turn-helix transcriptional regulator [Actinomadura syzygii]|uniref:Helix-turn-helix domain-containing protein n=1 Tax=Actinomadura syzygii TaxID=1427538 RepID=A0A5D0UDE6_9ACTN|nr:helix-turn-helix transcriptional regulator [Actinomadura syzygii]TYC15129.1 helix-turn-helix domain-containing protein [Actinomadura syzygii]